MANSPYYFAGQHNVAELKAVRKNESDTIAGVRAWAENGRVMVEKLLVTGESCAKTISIASARHRQKAIIEMADRGYAVGFKLVDKKSFYEFARLLDKVIYEAKMQRSRMPPELRAVFLGDVDPNDRR